MTIVAITGNLKDLMGDDFINTRVDFVRDGVASQDGATVIPTSVSATSDAVGAIAISLYNGNYKATIDLVEKKYIFDVAVPDSPTANLADLINVPQTIITPPQVVAAQDAQAAAEAAAADAAASAAFVFVYDTETDMIASATLIIGGKARTRGSTVVGDGGAQDWQIVTAGLYTTSATVLDLTGIAGQAVSLKTHFDTVAEFLADTRPDVLFVADQFFTASEYRYKKTTTGLGDLVTAGSVEWLLDGDLIPPEALNAVGDGSTDDTTILNKWLDSGKSLYADPDKTYAFTTQLTPAANVRIFGKLNLELKASIAGSGAAVLFGADPWVQNIKVNVATGLTIRRVVNASVSTGIFGNIEVTSVDQQNNRTDSLDGAIYLGATNTTGDLITDKFDNGIVMFNASNIRTGDIVCTNYVRGFHAKAVTGLITGKVNCSIASVNASASSGHNGVLLDEVVDYNSGAHFIMDSGEHGWRIGGDVGGTGCQIITIPAVTTLNTGQCGLKINDSSELTRNIKIGGLFVTDAASAGSPGSNEDGLRLEKAKDISIGTVSVTRQNNSKSCYDGVYIAGCERVDLPDVNIESAANHSVAMTDVVGGLAAATKIFGSIHIGNLISQGSAADVININATVQNLDHITVMNGYARDSASGSVVDLTTNAGAGTGGVPNPLIFKMDYHNVSAALTTISTATRIYTVLTFRG